MHAQPPIIDLNGPLTPDPILINYSGYEPANPRPGRARAHPAGRPPPRLRAPSASTCGASAARAGRSPSSSRSRPPTATTWSRPSPPRTGPDANVGLFGISYPGISQLFTAAQQPAEPDRHHPAVGHRRHLPLDAVPRRHPQQRLRHRLGRRAGPRQPGRARRPAVGPRPHRPAATPPARPTRPCTTRPRTSPRSSPRTSPTTRPGSTTWPPGPSSTRSTSRSSSAGPGRTSRPAATSRPCSTSWPRTCPTSTSP